jgi:hypothetical protein
MPSDPLLALCDEAIGYAAFDFTSHATVPFGSMGVADQVRRPHSIGLLRSHIREGRE